ncbi:hypothetical protein WA158_000797 [Blastocystis sp. Blastoise]
MNSVSVYRCDPGSYELMVGIKSMNFSMFNGVHVSRKSLSSLVPLPFRKSIKSADEMSLISFYSDCVGFDDNFILVVEDVNENNVEWNCELTCSVDTVMVVEFSLTKSLFSNSKTLEINVPMDHYRSILKSWYMNDSYQYSSLWSTISYNNSPWVLYDSIDFPFSSLITSNRYYRQDYILSNNDKYIDISIYTSQSCSLYINGKTNYNIYNSNPLISISNYNQRLTIYQYKFIISVSSIYSIDISRNISIGIEFHFENPNGSILFKASISSFSQQKYLCYISSLISLSSTSSSITPPLPSNNINGSLNTINFIPSNFTYGSHTFTLYLYQNVLIYVNVTGNNISFSSTPSLPNGLYFDVQGNIFGIPTSIIEYQSFVITALNEYGQTTVTILLQVLIPRCIQDNEWPLTNSGDSIILSCSDTINYIGNRKRDCLLGYPAIWSEINDTCIYKPPILTLYSTIINGYQYDTISPFMFQIIGQNISSVQIEPKLPLGLILQIENSIIYGIPQETYVGILYLSIKNPGGVTTKTIQVNIISKNCTSTEYSYISSYWPETARGLTAYINCPQGQMGIQSRACIIKDESYYWGKIDQTHCFIYNDEDQPNDDETYILFSIILEGIQKVYFGIPSIYELFRSYIVDILSTYTINDLDIQIIDYRIQTSNSTYVKFRITVYSHLTSDITKVLSYSINGSTSLLTTKCKESNNIYLQQITSTYISTNGITYISNNMNSLYILIIGISVIICITIIIIVFITVMYNNIKSQNKRRRKHQKYSSRIITKSQVILFNPNLPPI